MASRERDHNIWKSPGGALFFKLGIPPALREHFKSTTGRPKVKISEPLGTYDPHEARVIRDQKLAHYQRVFARLATGAALSPEEIATERRRVHRSTLDALLATAPMTTFEDERLNEVWGASMRAQQPGLRAEVAAEVRAIADEKYGTGIITEDSETWKELWMLVARAKAKAFEDRLIVMFRSRNALDEFPSEPTPTMEQPATPAPTLPVNNGNGNGNLERFSVALDHYLAWLRNERQAAVATVADYKSKAGYFVKFANDPPLGAVTIDDAKDFLNEVAKDTEAATVNQYHIVCKAVFEHARKERHRFFGSNPFSFQERKHVVQSKAKFTTDELNRLFGSSTFTEREIKPKTYDVESALPWATAIALYSGAALEEVAQLRPKDLLLTENGIGWVINILPEAALSGRLKRVSRKRNIPLHPELERLGLLEYLRALPRGAERLFPGLPIHKSKNKFSPPLGKAFNNWRRKLGIERPPEKLDFHSLRHTFGKAIEDVGITETDRARLMGHKVKGISSSVYSSPELKRVAPLVADVKWDGLCIK